MFIIFDALKKEEIVTHQDLLNKLKELSPEQLQMDVTAGDWHDEYYKVDCIIFETENGVLDKNHPVLMLEG